jgi:Fe-S-cluster-containing dehydrogenase component/DMSO reductase anchor subunit
MRKGFIFNQNLCVGCSACDAACILENGWNFHPRTVYKFNHEALPSVPIINLSMACNHCELPSCQLSCPVNALLKDSVSGAILIDENKCIGCSYCQWNCPYDAPKSDPVSRLFGKCNLCFSLLAEGGLPACASACPTGALEYNEIPVTPDNRWLAFFPQKNLDPSIFIPEKKKSTPLRIVPEEIFDTDCNNNKQEKSILGEWSLVVFSFLATISVSFTGTSLLTGNLDSSRMPLILILLAGIFSVFHLGKKLRAWSAVLNFFNSPLSREIVFYLVYLLLSFMAIFSNSTGIIVASSATGAILLLAIDSVYAVPDHRRVSFHSGQTFITGLLMISFFAGLKPAFIFLALIKLITGIYKLYKEGERQTQFGLRFLRLAILTITCICLITGVSYPDPVVSVLFITGELADRILFYFDFEPLNINTLITRHFNIIRNEKKKD